MKQEYLLIKQKNEYVSTKEQFNSFLKTNGDLSIDDGYIIVRNSKLSYCLNLDDDVNKSKEIVFHLIVSTEEKADEEGVKDLNCFNDVLNNINITNGNQFTIYTIWDEISMYYSNLLYPKIMDIENRLRLIIYRFMIRLFGSSWYSKYVPDEVKGKISSVTKGKDKKSNANQLINANFIELANFMSTAYSLSAINDSAFIELKAFVDKASTKEDVISGVNSFLESYELKSNWDRFFSDIIEDDNFLKQWNELYDYRNKVAHSKIIKEDDYIKANKIIKELEEAFKQCIKKIDEINATPQEINAVSKMAENVGISLQIDDDITSPSISILSRGMNGYNYDTSVIGSFATKILNSGVYGNMYPIIKNQSNYIVSTDESKNIGLKYDPTSYKIKESIDFNNDFYINESGDIRIK